MAYVVCSICTYNMNHVMRKPDSCICENKDADQLRGTCNREADQRLCFRYIDSTIHLLPKYEFQTSSHLQGLYSPVCVGPGRKPERLFSHNEAHFSVKLSRPVGLFESRCEKTGLRGFRPGLTQTGLWNHLIWLEA